MRPNFSPAMATGVALTILAGCAGGSGSGVPHLSPDRLVHVTLDSIVPRQVVVTYVDSRQPRPANSDTMLTEIGQAVHTIVTRAGIAEDPGASNRLDITFTYPDSSWHGMKPEDCIVMSVAFHLADGSHGSSGATSCFASKNLYGMRIASDPDAVYEDVVNLSFKGLDGLLGGHASP
jgi:hypothetical protein